MCVNPLIRFRFKYEPKSGPIPYFQSFDNKKKGFVIKSKKKLEGLFESHGHFLSFFDSYCDWSEIPCGRCEECRKVYSRDWSVRCYHESLYHDFNCFITLTIEDAAHARFMKEIERSCKNGTNKYCKGCSNGSRYFKYPINYSVNKGIILNFIKKMRDYLYRSYNISVRYFGVAEYGELNDRPHYHLLLFGYDFSRVESFKAEFSKKGVQMYISEELRRLWTYGASYVEPLNYNACAYVAQYCMKKVKPFDNEPLYDYYYGKVPEFLFMSKGNCQVNRCKFIDSIVSDKNISSLRDFKNPYCRNCSKTRGGLGFQWICDYLFDVKKLGYIVIDSKKYPIPKYYKNLINLTDSELYDKLHADNIYYVNELQNEFPDKNSTKNNETRHKINLAKLRSRAKRDM